MENLRTLNFLKTFSCKPQNSQLEGNEIDCFHSLMHFDAPHTLKIVSILTRENPGEILAIFSWKYGKFQAVVTFEQANQKLVRFHEQIQRLTGEVFGMAHSCPCHHQRIHKRQKSPHLKKSINQDHHENGRYEQADCHTSARRIATEELQVNTVSQHAITANADKSKLTGHHCRNQYIVGTNAVNWNEENNKQRQ